MRLNQILGKSRAKFSGFDLERPMHSSSATSVLQPSVNRKRGGYRPFGFMEMIAAFLALTPVCAVSGLMLAQILGFVPY